MKKYLYMIWSLFALLLVGGCEGTDDSDIDDGVTIAVEQLVLSVDGATTAGDSCGADLTKTIYAGDTFNLKALFTPADATNQNCIWTIEDDKGIVVFNANDGTVEGMIAEEGEYTAVITATSAADKSKSAKITINVTGVVVDVESIEIKANGESVDQVETYVDGVVRLAAAINPDNASKKEVKWEITEGEDVVEFDAVLGKVTAKTKGTAKIKVTSLDDESKCDEITIDVNTEYIKADDVTLSSTGNEHTLFGDEFDITATIGNETALYGALKWAVVSGDATIVGADSEKSVKIKAGTTTAGDVTIKLSIEVGDAGVVEKSYVFELLGAKVNVESLYFTIDDVAVEDNLTKDLSIGDNFNLKTVIEGEDGKTPTLPTYTLSIEGNDDGAISYNETSGAVVAIKSGEVTISVVSDDDTSKRATIILSVTNFVTEEDVTLSGSADLFPGKTATFTLDLGGKDYESITWSIEGVGATIPAQSTALTVEVTPSETIGDTATLTATIVVGDGSANIVKSITLEVFDTIPVVGEYCYDDYTTSATVIDGKTIIGIVYAVGDGVAKVVSINAPYTGVPWCSPDAGLFNGDAVSNVAEPKLGFNYMVYVSEYAKSKNETLPVEYPAFNLVRELNGSDYTFEGQSDNDKIWVIPAESELVAVYQWMKAKYGSLANINAAFATGGRTTSHNGYTVSSFAGTSRAMTTTDLESAASAASYTYNYGGVTKVYTPLKFETKERAVYFTQNFAGVTAAGQHKAQTNVHLVPIMQFKYGK